MAIDINKKVDEFKDENPQIPNYIIGDIKKNLPKNIKENELSKVLEIIKSEHKDAQISPNEAIGVITAQSIGEPATQMTLNTFHFAGVSNVEGLPRIIEIMDLRKGISNPSMKIYLKKEFSNEENIKKVARKIKQTKLAEFATSFDINIEEKQVRIKLNLKELKSIDLNPENIIDFLDKKIKKKACIKKSEILIQETQKAGFKDLLSSKELALNSIVFGIKGISDLTLIKKNDEYMIVTSGVALKQVMKIEEVDTQRVYSNDIIEMNNNFGVEAARQTIINEILDVVESQGLSVNYRHLTLIADMMTQSGDPKGMTRFGIVADKMNVLTRASFEIPLRHLSRGALASEENDLTSITENVMTNQMITVGTGIPKIKVKNS
jgi:DNA-directed RNA polymerase subunit A"